MLVKEAVQVLKDEIRRETRSKGYSDDEITVVVMYQSGPFGVVKVDDFSAKFTSMDVEELSEALHNAEDKSK